MSQNPPLTLDTMDPQKRRYLDDASRAFTLLMRGFGDTESVDQRATDREYRIGGGNVITNEEIALVFPGRTMEQFQAALFSVDALARLGRNDGSAAAGFHIAAIEKFTK